MPMTAPPSTCRFNCIGLTTMPGSTAIVYFSTAIAPVPGVTAICADARPIGSRAEHHRDAAAAHRRVAGRTGLARGDGRVSHPDASRTALSTLIDALFLGMIDAELDGVGAGQRGRFADGQFAREILLELARRAHAVIAQSDGERRGLLADLDMCRGRVPSGSATPS